MFNTYKYKYCNKPSSHKWIIKDVEDDMLYHYISVGRKFGKSLDLKSLLSFILNRHSFIDWWNERYYWDKYSTKFPEQLFCNLYNGYY